ncbi:MAG: efflux RND transporter periplasmic adaptor subunit [Burkholderiales bacterium]
MAGQRRRRAAIRDRPGAARRGDLTVTVSATGNLQPTNQVDVGSELSGTLQEVLVDDNDRVTKGQVLARLDLARLQDTVDKSRAALAAARAQLQQAEATEAEARANLARQRHVHGLSGGKVPSQAEMQSAEAAVARAAASAASARAAIAQAAATLKSDQTNVTKASIRSPINGVVLARKVDPGQTVAATLQAPTLFTIAEDLAQMKLEVDVDEADVGSVREGQSASFTVDAHPNRQYPSRVVRVGLGAQTKENVVSYLTVLAVENKDLSLRPGMTGSAEIVTTQREGVLLVPNAALRFVPPAPEAAAKSGGSVLASLLPRRPRPVAPTPSRAAKGSTQRVWVLREGKPAALAVTVGVSDGRLTEISGGELREGMAVITEMLGAAK